MRVEQNEHEVNSTDILNNINIALIQNNLRSVSCQNKIIKNRNLQKKCCRVSNFADKYFNR